MEKFVSQKKSKKAFVAAQIFLRVVAAGATIVAALLMATNKQTVNLIDEKFNATWTYVGAFKFFVGANVIACCFTLASFLIYIIGSNSPSYFVLLLLDMMAMSLVLAGSSATTTVGIIGKYGNQDVGWAAICDQFGKFCNRIILSLVVSYTGLVALVVLTLLNAFKSKHNAV